MILTVKLSLILSICLIAACGSEIKENRPPNIIVILADDLGYMDTTIYGSELYETPHIDALAKKGVLFTNAYSASPLCSPSRASLLTGMQTGRLRLTTAVGHLPEEILDPKLPDIGPPAHRALTPESRTRLPPDAFTYAERLKKVGYSTAFMGKWHLGPPPFSPENHGFDVVVGGREHPGPPPPGSYFAPWSAPGLTGYKEGTHISAALAQEAIKFISENKDQPFLLNLWYYDVHAPYQADTNLLEKYQTKVALNPSNEQRSPEMAAMISSLDTSIGRVISHLDAENLLENTVIIFTSDNGGNMYDRINGVPPTSNAPLRGGKGINYEGGVKVPMIISYPPLLPNNTTTDFLSNSVDLFPTILEIAGALAENTPTDGVSLLSAMLQSSTPQSSKERETAMFSHFPHYVAATSNIPNTSVRLGDWKLYKFYADSDDGSHRHELYNLTLDPGERNNVAYTEVGLVEQLDKLIDQNNVETASLVPQENPAYGVFDLSFWRVKGATAKINADILRLESNSIDPMLIASAPVTNKSVLTLTFKMRSQSSGNGQLFWTTNSNPSFSESKSSVFSVAHDGEWHSYELDVSESEKVGLLRLDPSRSTGQIELKDIRISN